MCLRCFTINEQNKRTKLSDDVPFLLLVWLLEDDAHVAAGTKLLHRREKLLQVLHNPYKHTFNNTSLHAITK
jgi:hypothetical protein